MATINVRGDGVVVICEYEDNQIVQAWWFALAPGDVWAMPGGGDANGYVRWECTHGLPLVIEQSKAKCKQGCMQCRISLNCRFGVGGHTAGQL